MTGDVFPRSGVAAGDPALRGPSPQISYHPGYDL